MKEHLKYLNSTEVHTCGPDLNPAEDSLHTAVTYMYEFSTVVVHSRHFCFFSASILAYTFQYGEALRSWASCVYIHEEIKLHQMKHINESPLPIFTVSTCPLRRPFTPSSSRPVSLATPPPLRTTSLLPALPLSFSPTPRPRTTISTHAPLPRPGASSLVSLSPHTRTPCALPPPRSPRTSGISHPPRLCGSSSYLCPPSGPEPCVGRAGPPSPP